MPTVFLSYRKSDTAAESERLTKLFEQRFGDDWVFRDVGDIPYGTDWDEVLERELAAARIILVLIGPTWLSELKQRMSQPAIDYARREVASALATRARRVIPVLIRGAAIPRVRDLPADLASLPMRQAFTLRESAWDIDVEQLIAAIGRPYRWNLAVVRAVAFVFVSIVVVKVLVPIFAPDRVNDYPFARLLLLSLAGAYGVVEVVLAYLYARRQRTG